MCESVVLRVNTFEQNLSLSLFTFEHLPPGSSTRHGWFILEQSAQVQSRKRPGGSYRQGRDRHRWQVSSASLSTKLPTYERPRHGNSSGIGYATVQHLARQGAKVYIGARSEERAKAAIERLRAEGLQPRNGELEWLELDLSDPRKAKASAEAFLAKEKQLDILGKPPTVPCNYDFH